MQDTLTLSIEGMHCGACVRRVTNALQAVPGVAVGSVEIGSAKLAFDSEEATAQEIAAAVSGIGFTASITQ
ncbi:MAG TPA: heavy-metal-associated domain-containing protein [Granulicella sp.]|jgi:copper chaperone|nr:heavy-metal-associated domain-containing protein [Granulicella sp.]